MTYEQLFNLLKTLPVPVAYGVFEEEQEAPYIQFFRDTDDTENADDTVYYKGPHIQLELYTKKKDQKLEEKIEKLLTDNNIPYGVDETYLPDEKLRVVFYEFNI